MYKLVFYLGMYVYLVQSNVDWQLAVQAFIEIY